MEKVCPKCLREYGSADMFCPEDGTPLVMRDGAAAPTVIEPPPPPSDDALLGRVVDGRYELTQLLGVGGMGRVYLAQHRFLKRQVAVKILHRGRVDDPTELVRFKRTAVHAGTIANDHVAGIYDFGETSDGLVYLAMEYVPGDTLARMVKAEGPFEPTRVVELTRQIASGLDAAHAQGIIHRDLKPDNVMVMRDRDRREMVKIVDFGIAKALGNESRNVTQLGAVVGTLMYMSPEQLAGGDLDRRSDVYSLGLVVYFMLAGTLPFAGTRPEEVIYARFDPAGPRPLATVRPSVAWPPDLQAVLDRALAREASARFTTAGALASALGSAIAVPKAPARQAAAPDSRAPAARERGVQPSAPPTPARPAAGAPRPPEQAAPHRERTWPVAGARRVKQRLTTLFTGPNARASRVAAMTAAAVLIVAASAAAVKYGPWNSTVEKQALGSLPLDTVGGTISIPGTDTGHVDTAVTEPPAEPPPEPPSPPPRRGNNGAKTADPPVKQTPLDPADPEVDRRAARRALERYRWQLHPDSSVSPPAARTAIARLDALMPRLRTRNDSLFAMLYQAHAYFHLQDLDRQCAVLRRIRDRAPGTRLEPVIGEYFGYGKCSSY
ncbi:MAG TPA: serine/threonine-protein kinase [Gemmatimonadaceae bacterium]|jgi:serine/threonine-protein kinase|nr:serine/threonine-protein kinase [Gemmatimonadaceae bacterium]